MKKNSFAAIIVAAGYSSRMGDFKPLLKFGEYTAVEMLINTFKASGIDNIIVVVGYRGNEIIEILKNLKVKWIENENYSKGMYSSVIKGLELLDEENSGFFMIPVDIPLIKKNTVEILKEQYLKKNKGIIYPSFNEKLGHPPFIDCKYKSIIKQGNNEGGLKNILEKFKEDSVKVPVFDKSILMDMDTKEDYEKLIQYFNLQSPSIEECYCILNLHDVPNNIIKHCSEVSRITLNILNKLNENGYNFNENVLQASALLHDLARMEKNHAEAGAKILKNLGYEQVGNIISTHMDIEVDETEDITENEILYLADKVIKENKFVKLQERFSEYSLKFAGNFQALNKIQKRFDEADKIEKKIKNIVGKNFSYE
jgi:putative nucleotidyltransferase with HDIG domain